MKKILPLIKNWQPSSWKSLPIKQSPDWPSNELIDAVKKLESFPPLIPFDEIDSLKRQFKRVSDDKAFILIALALICGKSNLNLTDRILSAFYHECSFPFTD